MQSCKRNQSGFGSEYGARDLEWNLKMCFPVTSSLGLASYSLVHTMIVHYSEVVLTYEMPHFILTKLYKVFLPEYPSVLDRMEPHSSSEKEMDFKCCWIISRQAVLKHTSRY